jgi:glycine cleavage system H protein
MSERAGGRLSYRRSRFATTLPVDRRYTLTHHWLTEESSGIWRIGFTEFGVRLLGDLVECAITAEGGAPISLGQEVGVVEGFKAVTSLHSVAEGEFLGAGDDLRADVTFLETDPYGQGWLYRVRGRPDPASVDVHGYVSMLDVDIDRYLRTRDGSGKPADAR